MWTNVFKIGGLHQISWFQFLPAEYDLNPLPEKSIKAEQKDAATLLVLRSHLELQKEGFFSAWTNSFVGPWDPSQGMHNPDEKIKLWLFLPGRHSSAVETAHAAVSKLKVVGSGFWMAPGDSEEVAAAFSQALRNCIERALKGLSYLRFGDVFAKGRPFSQSEKPFRRLQPAIEFIFAATEEAIFVHVIISAKHVRTLSSNDMEGILRNRSSNKNGERLSVIVAPHGMRGRLTGCRPSDFVKQVYFSSSKVKTSHGISVLSIPSHIAQDSGFQLSEQSCYVEITLGFPGTDGDKKANQSSSSYRNFNESCDQKQRSDDFQALERTFIYPAEAVVVPVMHTDTTRSSLKRLWTQSRAGASDFGSYFLMNSLGFRSCDDMRIQQSHSSSSNSNDSSISSISSTSSDSDYNMTSGIGDLEADADSLISRQSGLSSNDQFDNDGHKLVSKRPRTGIEESSFGATVTNTDMEGCKSEYSSVRNSSVTAIVTNDQVGSHWDWDDENSGVGMDILLSEFGEFGDFFENDTLPFGEPPGTAESHALMLPAPDCGDVSSSPCTGVIMDMTDQSLFAGLEFSPFEGQPRPSAITIDDFHDKSQEFTRDGQSSGPGNYSSASTTTAEYDHVLKDEAMISFAPEYKAVQTSVSDLSSSIFRCPYTPRSIKVESSDSSSNYYVYGAEPPSSSCTDEKLDLVLRGKLGLSPRVHYKKHYTQVESVKKGRRRLLSSNCTASLERMTSSFPFSGFSSAPIAFKSVERKSVMEAEHFLLSPKTVLASEVECIMFQAAMCRIRHLVWSSTCNNLSNRGLGSKLTGDQYTADPGPKQDKYYDVKKKDSVPIRIAGDANVAMRDGSLHTPIGVWRSVGNPKGSKPTSSPSIENSSPSLSHSPFQDESSIVAYSRSQPLQELLDCMTLLVQQATSFVDVALDDDGSYGWLALQEQCRRRFSCGPSMVHAGCGGVLASCHSLDGAGVQLPDPLSACVHASSVMSLLQSDVKVALKSAFGNMDGPLTVTDWCKGHCHSSDAGTTFSDSYSVESTAASEGKDSLSTATLAVSEPISPTHSSVASSFLKVCRTSDGARMDETIPNRLNQEICSSESDPCSRLKQTVLALPSPAILVGYQDDWLKTSANSLQLWEKAPLEPYALPKPMTYYVVCPDIDPLTSAAADFFQQLGTVYETCKLGSHTPQNIGGHVDLSSGKSSASGFVLINSPESVKVESSNASVMGSISDYLLALSNGWNLRTFLVSLSNVIKALRLGSSLTINQRECSSGPAMVIYVVCPFSDPSAVLQTVVEASSSLGSTVLSQEKERRSLLYTQVGKSLSCSAAVDEASVSNMVTLSGFSIPKLVLQIVTAEAILGVTSPPLNELVILKEIAFTVYNKARRFARASYNESPGALVRPPLMHSPIPGMWKDCAGPRTTSREGDLDTGFRWDNSSWNRIGGLSCDTNRPFSSDTIIHDDVRYMFEPLFILAEPASSLEQQGVSPCNNVTSESSSRSSGDDGGFMQSSNLGNTEIGASSLLDGGPDYQKTVSSLHCCYGWTEDWRWLVCIWTDSRGELLDSHIFPFGGISSRQDTKGLQHLFVQVLHQACQILSSFSSCDQGAIKPRDIVITRIGFFFELERQEWQKAIYLVGGNEVKKWALQLRRSGATDGISASSNGHQQEMSLVQERPSPSFYNSSQTKASSSGFIKGGGGGGLGQNSTRKQQQIMGGQAALFQWVQSISLVGVSLDHSLNLVFPAETSAYLEGFSPVKSLGSTCSSSTSTNVSASSYIVIPCPSMRYLPTRPLQLPTCLTSESPPLAHLLQSKGCAIPLSTGFVVSKSPHIGKVEEQPSVLSVSLVDYYGPSKQQQLVRGGSKQGGSKVSESSETHLIVQCLAAELHSLSWLTASPAYLERRTALPFHCDIILRLTRLLHFADNHLSQHPDIKL